MGVLTEIVAAPPSDAAEIATNLDRSHWQTVDLKGHSELTLAALWCLLDPTIDQDDAESRFTLLTDDNQDGPWVFAIPDPLVSLIQSIDDQQVSTVHQAWCENEDLDVDDDGDPEALLEQLRELIALSRSMKPSDRLLMWVCL